VRYQSGESSKTVASEAQSFSGNEIFSSDGASSPQPATARVSSKDQERGMSGAYLQQLWVVPLQHVAPRYSAQSSSTVAPVICSKVAGVHATPSPPFIERFSR